MLRPRLKSHQCKLLFGQESEYTSTRLLLLQQFQFAFSSLDLGWVSAQDQQESEGEEEEEEDLLGAWTYSCPWRFIPVLHKFLQTWTCLGGHCFLLV